LQDLDWVLAM
jgi:hypothetical protein